MKTKRLWLGLALCLMLGCMAVWAENSCIEAGPHQTVTCVESGSVSNSGSLSYYSLSVTNGSAVTPPTLVTTPSFNNGQIEIQMIYDCPGNESQNVTNYVPVHYFPGSLYFVPPIPSVFTNTSSATYTALVNGQPSSIVGWWKAEGNALDSIGTNNGTLVSSVSYGAGQVGQAFLFSYNSSNNAVVTLGNAPNLESQDFTVEAWIQPAASLHSPYGIIFSAGDFGYGFGIDASGNLLLGTSAQNTNDYTILSGHPITDTNWHHVAITKAETNLTFYIDGVAYDDSPYDMNFRFNGSHADIGAKDDNGDYPFLGSIDELAVYNCALSGSEIQAIYEAGTNGMGKSLTNLPPSCYCTTAVTDTVGTVTITTNPGPPIIVGQPQNQTVINGGESTFVILPAGVGPFTYQWYYNTNTALAGDTNASLTLTDIETNNGGDYSVVVSNAYGAVTSSIASLTVDVEPCDGPPLGMVAWWRAESNYVDSVGDNVAQITNTTFGTGEVGQAFVFNGNGQRIEMTAGSTNEQIGDNLTIEMWIKRANPTNVSLNGGGWQNAQLADQGWGCYGFGIYGVPEAGVNTTNGVLVMGRPGTDGVGSSRVLVTDTNWHHVAVTKSGTNMWFYVDGVGEEVLYPQGSTPFTFNGYDGSSPDHHYDFAIGAYGDSGGSTFLGSIDELAVYNRVLSSNEIAAIYLAGTNGKCAIPPEIVTQPQSQVVLPGQDATFAVEAIGDTPLSYQWYFNGSILTGATADTLTLTNLQYTNAGNYDVTIANPFGSVTSTVAALSVLNPLADDDYDGRNNSQEIVTDGTDPENPNSVVQVQLGYWPFDDTNAWAGAEGQLPLFFTNIVGVPSWSTNAVVIDSTNPAALIYRDVETNGDANINCRAGTVMLWFWPDWNSGTGPGDNGRLIEVGNQSTNGWWSLLLSSDGTQMQFITQSNTAITTNLTTAVNWSSNTWHQIVLTYCPTNSSLYLDGQPIVTNGLAVSNYPSLNIRTNGFCIGSDWYGNNQARGRFDELYTYNYPLTAATIIANYQAAITLDSDGDGISNILENELGTDPYTYNSPNGLTGAVSLILFTPLK